MSDNEIMVIGDQIKRDIDLQTYFYGDGYDADSALKAAEIIFRQNNDFRQCSQESKYKCILDMMVQGLNPLKGQCSFIPYGKELQLVREYPGSIMVAKREDKRIADIRARVIRDGEVFQMDIINGLMTIKKHQPTIASWNNPIIGAYAVAVDENERIIDMDLMSWEDMINTWKNTNLKIKGEPVVKHDGTLHPASNHAKYPERMARKTIIHRLCRAIIKSSPNKQLQESAERSDEEQNPEQIFQREVRQNANTKLIDFPAADQGAVVDAEPMATKAHADEIKKLAEQTNRVDKIMEDVSGFVGRQISRIRELTAKEAEGYIDTMKLEMGRPDDDVPDWGVK